MTKIAWGEPEIKPAEFLFLANTETYNLEHYFQCKFDEIKQEVLRENHEGAVWNLLTDTEENKENACPAVRS